MAGPECNYSGFPIYLRSRGSAKKLDLARSSPQPPRLRHEISLHPVVSFVMYVCSLFALPSSTASTRDGRPHIFGKVEDVDTDFLVDTGASVTVISETILASSQSLEITTG